MARKRARTINTQTWEPARNNINRMERAVINVMAKLPDVEVSDVIDWLVPADQLSLLRAATPYADLNSSSFTSDQMRSVSFPFGKVTFYLDFIHMGCVPPKKSFIVPQPDAPKAGELRKCVETIAGIAAQHRKLREILAWFTDKDVTPGFARHYWPTLQSLLPSDHKYFDVKGGRFKDEHMPYEIVTMLREAPEIIAKGLLCDPVANGMDKKGRSLVRVRADGASDQVFTLFAKEG